MFRPMRRKQKEITMEAAKKLLLTERRAVLAVNGDDGYPYAVPVNFFYDEENSRIYFHGSRVGHKSDALKNCDKVCFTVYGNETVKDEAWAPYLQSVVIFGRCHPIADSSTVEAKLRLLAGKYYPDQATIDQEIAQSIKAVQMFEIEIEHLTGKMIQER